MKAGADPVSWVAVAGFVLGLVNLVWQIVHALTQRPRLSVVRHGVVSLRATGGPPVPRGQGNVYSVTVINGGGAAATIEDIGYRVDSAGYSNLSALALRHEGIDVDGPDLPCRVEARDHKTWHIAGEHVVARLADIGPIYGWATEFVPVRRWPGPESRRIGRRFYRSRDTSVLQ